MNRHAGRTAKAWSAVPSAGLLALVATPSCFGAGSPAPSSNDDDAGFVGDGSSALGDDALAQGGPNDAGATSVCLNPDAGPLDPNCVIDDMSVDHTAYGGYWYTYSDRTLPNTATLVPNPAGTISPTEGAPFPPNTAGVGGPTVPGLGAPANFREFSGQGLTLWGAGMGFDLQDVLPVDAGGGDAADAAAAPGVPTAFDASRHLGIGFYGRSNSLASQTVGVHFTDIREAVVGGICDADAAFTVFDGGADTINGPTECSDDFLKNVTFTPDWAFFTVTFASARQGFTDGDPLAAIDPSKLVEIHFQVNNPGYLGTGPIAPEPAWDISVAYITWYDGP
jgi:hypothetical protein